MSGCHVQPEQMFNLIFGYNDQYAEVVSSTNAVVGTNELLGTVVPSGEVWVVTAALAFDVQTAASAICIGLYDGSEYYYAIREKSPAAASPVNLVSTYVMKPGDKALGRFFGCVAGDDIYAHFLGYKMKLSQ